MATITQLSQLDPNAKYSYADYLNWQLEQTVELIKGKISLMSPVPSLDHQRITTRLTSNLLSISRNKLVSCLSRHLTYVCMTAANRWSPIRIFIPWCSPIFALSAITTNSTRAAAWRRRIGLSRL